MKLTRQVTAPPRQPVPPPTITYTMNLTQRDFDALITIVDWLHGEAMPDEYVASELAEFAVAAGRAIDKMNYPMSERYSAKRIVEKLASVMSDGADKKVDTKQPTEWR